MSRCVYFYESSGATPRGGVKQSYRHVEILCRNGIDAAIVHRQPRYRASWFASTAPVIDLAAFRERFRAGEDIVVTHEGLGPQIFQFPPPRVIFNQNVYYGFSAIDEDSAQSPYDDATVICVSDHNAELLRFAYPRARVLRVQIGVDATRFRARSLRAKKLRVVYPASKGESINAALREVVSSRARAGTNGLGELEWVALQGKTEEQVAQLLEESLFFLFASVEEGYALLPIEAMLAGCILLTHGNGPQREYVPAPFLHTPHDVLGMANTIEMILARAPVSLDEWQPICDAAREHVTELCSLAREEASVLDVWRQILAKSHVD